MSGDWFIGAVVVLQASGGLTYLWQSDWKQFLVWAGIAVSNLAYLSLSRS